ncbi:unnamed protein product, partial [marine sediment metagenome]
LNELEAFEKTNPTTENICRMIYEQIEPLLPPDVAVSRVTCWESDGCAASYFRG